MILELYYKLKHSGQPVPYYYKRSVLGEIWHLTRKFICQNIAPNCVTNFMRIRLYRMVFILPVMEEIKAIIVLSLKMGLTLE